MIERRWNDLASRWVAWSVVVPGLIVFAAAIGWPTIALIVRAFAQQAPLVESAALSGRQFELLFHTIALVFPASLGSIVAGLSISFSLSMGGMWWRRTPVLVLFAACVACPPAAYAFGWERLLPSSIDGSVRCVWTWALWSCPIPALLIGTAWRRIAHGPYHAACLDAGRFRAIQRVALPALAPHVALASSIVFVLLLNEYTVPHACGLTVYATELLGIASSTSSIAAALTPSLPPVTVTGATLLAVYYLWKFICGNDQADARGAFEGQSAGSPVGPNTCLGITLATVLIAPITGLLLRLGSPVHCIEAIRVYGSDILVTAGVALAAGLGSAFVALTVARAMPLTAIVPAWVLLFGFLPGSIIGWALIAGFNTTSSAWLFDNWPIIAIGFVARFGWVGALAGLALRRLTPESIMDQARTDGATPAMLYVSIRLRHHWPVLAASGILVASLSLGEIATTSLLRVPWFSPVSLIIVEKFHRFEDGMLAALCLIQVTGGIIAAAVAGIALRRLAR